MFRVNWAIFDKVTAIIAYDVKKGFFGKVAKNFSNVIFYLYMASKRAEIFRHCDQLFLEKIFYSDTRDPRTTSWPNFGPFEWATSDLGDLKSTKMMSEPKAMLIKVVGNVYIYNINFFSFFKILNFYPKKVQKHQNFAVSA